MKQFIKVLGTGLLALLAAACGSSTTKSTSTDSNNKRERDSVKDSDENKIKAMQDMGKRHGSEAKD
jgi:hypothetical protein